MTALRLYDNTRLSDFKRCPRYYYYRHIRNWVASGVGLPLVFGSAWHAAQEEIWPALVEGKMPQNEVVERAYLAFLAEWQKEGLPWPLDLETEQEFAPRTPANALEMIHGYVEIRAKQMGDLEMVSVEKPFAVPLDPEDATLFYVGKIDKIIRVKSRKKYRAIEHKTTTAYSKGAGFRSSFVDSFSPNSQVDGYLYCLHMTFPDAVEGVWVDAALVHKTEHEVFKFIPVEKKLDQLDAWLWETRSWIDLVEANKKQAEGQHNHEYMAAFPKNTNSCHDFNKSCQYIDLCKAWANPSNKPLPLGFQEEVWDPLDRLDTTQLELPR